jgi:RNA polymerase sigma factor (sigma-70 family)
MGVCTAVRDWTALNQSDADLARRAVAGDRTAERELLVKCEPIFRCLYGRVFPRLNCHADDCVQEALIKLAKELPLFRPERGAFGKWAKSVARSAFYNFLDKHVFKRRDISLDALPEDAISTQFGPEEECFRHIVAEEVQKLEPDQSAAVGGHYDLGLTDEKIAESRRMERRRVGYRREQGERNLGKRFRNSPFMSIRPKSQFSRYYYIVTSTRDVNEPALLGGEDGDTA